MTPHIHLIGSLNNLSLVCVVVFVALELVFISPQAYAKFSGAKLTVSPVDWTWKTLTGESQTEQWVRCYRAVVFIQKHALTYTC